MKLLVKLRYSSVPSGTRKSGNSAKWKGLKSPFNPVTANSLACWIKSVLYRAGVDTKIFSAHSTRSAAASNARRSGMSIDAILQAGSWARESTFNRFYNRLKPLSVPDVIFRPQQ